MNHMDVLKRALRITWRNRALWVFGILFALTGGGAGSGFRGYSFGGGDGGSSQASNFQRPWFFRGGDWPFGGRLPSIDWPAVAGIIALILMFILVLWIISMIIRYVSDNALIRMVDHIEETGSSDTVGEGFRKGWSRPAWRMFLIDLVVGIPFAIVAIALILLGLAPLLLLTIDAAGVQVLSIILTVGAMLLMIALLVVAGAIIDVLLRIAHRQTALAGTRTIESISSAYRLIRQNLKDIGLIWLLMVAVGIGWGLLMIPVFLVVLILAGAVGGIPAALIYTATKSIGWAAAIGAPLGLLTLFAPLVFLGGLYAAFSSTVWTLTFRDVQTLDAAAVLEAAISEPPAE